MIKHLQLTISGHCLPEQEHKGSSNLKQVVTAHPPSRAERNECKPAYCSSSALYSSTVGSHVAHFRLGFPTSVNATTTILIDMPTGPWEPGRPSLRSFLAILDCLKLTIKIHHHQKHLSFREILIFFFKPTPAHSSLELSFCDRLVRH